jgi:hypothetical protein
VISTEYQWIAVRCCCQPAKVLGFLRVTAQQIRAGYLVLPPKINRTEGFVDDPMPKTGITVDPPVQLAIKRIGEIKGESYGFENAVYSEDRPIEFWREVKGFVEAGAPPKSTSHDWDMMRFREGERAPGGSDW